MDPKDQLLSSITTLASQNRITEGEVLGAFQRGKGIISPTAPEETTSRRETSLSKALYFLGGVVILIGVIILIVQNWNSFGSIGQILITLGVGAAAYASAVILKQKPELNVASQVFAAIAGVLMPLGFGVLLYNMGVTNFTAEVNLGIAGVMLIVYGISIILFKDVVYSLFSILYGTWVYGALASIMLRGLGYEAYRLDLYQYLIMVLGGAYLFIGYALSKSQSKEYRRLAKSLFFFGTIGLLAPGLTIGGFWDVLYPIVVFGAIILSVYVQRSVFLRLGSLFLMIYLVKISAKYFAGSVGWPVALVFGGVLLMGVGYLTYYLNKKYIKGSEGNISANA